MAFGEVHIPYWEESGHVCKTCRVNLGVEKVKESKKMKSEKVKSKKVCQPGVR